MSYGKCGMATRIASNPIVSEFSPSPALDRVFIPVRCNIQSLVNPLISKKWSLDTLSVGI